MLQATRIMANNLQSIGLAKLPQPKLFNRSAQPVPSYVYEEPANVSSRLVRAVTIRGCHSNSQVQARPTRRQARARVDRCRLCLCLWPTGTGYTYAYGRQVQAMPMADRYRLWLTGRLQARADRYRPTRQGRQVEAMPMADRYRLCLWPTAQVQARAKFNYISMGRQAIYG